MGAGLGTAAGLNKTRLGCRLGKGFHRSLDAIRQSIAADASVVNAFYS
jgi:hypothetical protein